MIGETLVVALVALLEEKGNDRKTYEKQNKTTIQRGNEEERFE